MSKTSLSVYISFGGLKNYIVKTSTAGHDIVTPFFF